jgi:hypothetical protein
MALTNSERQAKYREQIQTGERKRFQFTLPLEIGIKADYLCQALGCNKTELFAKLIMDEWALQGSPIKRKPGKVTV